ncbi:MAG: hypothetical protein IJW03_03440 [Clostridia bacterium]|nr:hypothetical protein [Clostridia bacterium]
MKKRILLAFLVLALSLATLASCAGLFGDDPDETKGEKTVFSSIIHDGTGLDLQDVTIKMRDIVGPMVSLNVYSDMPAGKGEVVFGNTDRAITLAAKAELENLLSKNTKYDCGYIVYTDGNSVAVYWNVDGMADIAIQKFIDTAITEKRLELDAGTLASEFYVKREFEAEKHWLALEAKADEEVVAAIRTLYNYFDGHKMAGWMANLYDPEIGGFYYSNSARDTAGYLPDIESTSQLLSTLVSCGAIADRNVYIPNEIKAKIVEFAKSLQSSEDGYFYHPQWPQGRENLNTDRYGRDIGSATGVITSFRLDTDGDGVGDKKQYPNWCAPNGVKCELHTGTDEKCSFPIATAYYTDKIDGGVATTLTSSVSSAVSKLQSSAVTPTASVSSHPDYSSREAFSAWLEAYNANIRVNSGNAHNLAAIQSEITQHGYADIVLEHLDRNLHLAFEEQTSLGLEPTGLWQSDINYTLVWSLLKYAGWYNNKANGKAFPEDYIPYIVKSCIKVTALEPDGAYAMNDLYNQWTSIQTLITNVNNHYPDSKKAEVKELIYSIVRENASDLITNSLKKIEPFKMDDGSFAYQSSGNSMTTIYGTPIAMGVREGDVNAVALCVGMYEAIFTCLGLPEVPLCNAEDGEYFVSELLSSEPIDKVGQTDGTFTFDDGGYSSVDVKFSHANTGSSLTVVDDPDGDDKALHFVSVTGEKSGDGVEFRPASHGSSCYIFETDIYVSSESDDGYLFQIVMGTRYMMTIKKSGTTVTFGDAPSDAHMNGHQNLATFSTNEWHRIRVEYYPHGDTHELETPKIKVWVDEEYLGVSDNYFGSYDNKLTSGLYTKAYFYSMKVPNTDIYLDNCFFSTDDKAFDELDENITDYRDTIKD